MNNKQTESWQGQHVVYILRCKDGTLYTGYTNHLSQRLRKHEQGKGAKYTRGRAPFELVYTAVFSGKSEALREEARLKKLDRSQKLALIAAERKRNDVPTFTR